MAKFIAKVQHHETIEPRVVARDKEGWFTTKNSSKRHIFHSKEAAEEAMKKWIPDTTEVKWQVEEVT